MGIFQSKPGGQQQQQLGIPAQMLEANTHSKRAALSKELANKILTIYFERADFKDVLDITSISACPRYVFTTAKALDHLLQSIQIDPRLGKDGEILFAPVSRLSPGLIDDKKEGTQELALRSQERNRMCMDVAYLYVRIFQMYAALSMTILDSDPVRRRYFYGSSGSSGPFAPSGYGPSGYAPQGQRPPGPSRAVGFGGGSQKGGDLSNTSIEEEIATTPFAPIIPFFTRARTSIVILQLDDKKYTSRGTFLINWDDSLSARNSMTLEAAYVNKTNEIECTVKMEYTNREKDQIAMYINNDQIQLFTRRFGNRWVFKYDTTESSTPDEFVKNIHKYFLDADSKMPAIRRANVLRARVPGAVAGIPLTSEKSAFNSFDQIKKIYDDQRKGGPFPKAYCIARAMTLMTPIFPSEVGPGGPYYSQICKSTYDFETKDANYMPRAGKQPKANIYLRSLVSLYYDDYTVRGGEVEFTQSEAARSKLRQGSTLLARLYNITTSPETFIDSTTPFKQFPMCSRDTLLQFRDEKFRQALYNTVIMKMIQFQETHTINVNNLLNRMFKIMMDPRDGKPTMKFGDELKVAGRQSVNKFCDEVRSVLLNYYLVSEGYYIQGINMIKSNPNTTVMV